jgi:hypothetical protein
LVSVDAPAAAPAAVAVQVNLRSSSAQRCIACFLLCCYTCTTCCD